MKSDAVAYEVLSLLSIFSIGFV